MMNLHILSDPVTDFWNWPKKVFDFLAFFYTKVGGLIGLTKTQLTKSEIWHGGQWAQKIFL